MVQKFMVEKFMIEKSGVEKSGVEKSPDFHFMVEKFGVGKFMVEKSEVERSGVEAWGWKVQGWNVLQPLNLKKYEVDQLGVCYASVSWAASMNANNIMYCTFALYDFFLRVASPVSSILVEKYSSI